MGASPLQRLIRAARHSEDLVGIRRADRHHGESPRAYNTAHAHPRTPPAATVKSSQRMVPAVPALKFLSFPTLPKTESPSGLAPDWLRINFGAQFLSNPIAIAAG